MKKQGKKWAVLLSVALAVTGLSGCGNSPAAPRQTTAWQENGEASAGEGMSEGRTESTGGTESTERAGENAGNPAGSTSSDAVSEEYPYTLKITNKSDSAYAAEDNALIASMNYDFLSFQGSVNPDTGKAAQTEAPEIQQALDLVNQDTEKQSGSFIEENRADAEDLYQNGKDAGIDMSGSYFSDENRLTVERADAGCLSISRDHYEYLGGPHGMIITQGYSFDGKTGKRLTLSDVLTDTDDFASLLYQETVKQAYGNQADGMDPDAEETVRQMVQNALQGNTQDAEESEEELTWYITGDGIKFIFDAYQLGAYAAGSFRTVMKASDYPDLLNPDYIQQPESSVTEILPDTETEIGGKQLLITTHLDENQDIDQVTVQYGDKSASFEEHGYQLSGYVITTPDGRYLYLNLLSENDWQQICDIDLEEDTLTCRDCEPGVYGAVLTDPDHMFLSVRTGLMSTSDIMRDFHPGEHGVPEGNTRFWLYTGLEEQQPPVLTLKQDVTLDVLDALESDTTREEAFQAGDKFTLFRTDNENIVDLRTEDGRYVRLKVDGSQWPEMVNDRYELEDLFDNTFFAG